MKFCKFLIVALLASAAIFSSCKKNSDNVNHHPLEGQWIGTYGFGNDVPAVYYSFDIKSDGTIDELNQYGNSKGGGTWSLNGNSFAATYQWKAPMNTVYSVVGTYDAAQGKITGTWGYGTNTTNGGLWEQTKD